MTVTPEEKNAMARLLNIMSDQPVQPITESRTPVNHNVELAGPGQITNADVNAMAAVLNRLNSVSTDVVKEMVNESSSQPYISEALYTEKVNNGVKVGRYQIMIKEDTKRLAGKQFYSIYNNLTNDTIADDISLYETALAVVRLLNSGKFANNPEVRKLFEQDDAYTSHRVDALIFKRKYTTTTDDAKKDIFESRYQASLDRAMSAKKAIKAIANGS